MAKSLRETLLLKPGLRGTEINPPDSYREWLQADTDGIDLSNSLSGEMGFLQIFMPTRDPLASSVEQFRNAVIRDTLVWISFPKGTSGIQSDLNRDALVELVSTAGMRPVTLIALDDTWSSMRLRPMN